MLAPDFYFQLPDRKLTRQEFIDRMHSLKITRFDASVLTVEPRGNDWSVLLFEKGEVMGRIAKRLLQFRVLGFGLLQDGDVGVGIFPQDQEVFVGGERPSAGCIGIRSL
jgi:hypothetical protein